MAATDEIRTYAGGMVRYDGQRKRLWVCGQRLHHGLTGAVAAGAGLGGLALNRFTPLGGIQWALLGTVLMAHDWNDRELWFRRGHQDQP